MRWKTWKNKAANLSWIVFVFGMSLSVKYRFHVLLNSNVECWMRCAYVYTTLQTVLILLFACKMLNELPSCCFFFFFFFSCFCCWCWYWCLHACCWDRVVSAVFYRPLVRFNSKLCNSKNWNKQREKIQFIRHTFWRYITHSRQ